jgi:hypothetical protein
MEEVMVVSHPTNDLGLINHVVLVIDGSDSMSSLVNEVVKVVDSQTAYLAQRSRELDQETRISVYIFRTRAERGRYWTSDEKVEIQCIAYDKDVLRLPTLSGRYSVDGRTPLIDASLQAISDLEKTATLYGDHAFLMYVFTDGQENASNASYRTLETKLRALPDNWTVACLVPDQSGAFEAKKFGFLPDNIALWKTTNAGVAEMGEVVRRATDNFMQARATGVRSSRGIFQLDPTNVTPQVVHQSLNRIRKGSYVTLAVPSTPYTRTIINPKTGLSETKTGPWPIKDFVERQTGRAYTTGAAYYQFTKPEKIQSGKIIALRERLSGDVYTGPEARQLLGLPNYEVKVDPAEHDAYDIFVQSTSINRNLVAGTSVLVL